MTHNFHAFNIVQAATAVSPYAQMIMNPYPPVLALSLALAASDVDTSLLSASVTFLSWLARAAPVMSERDGPGVTVTERQCGYLSRAESLKRISIIIMCKEWSENHG